jgi:hypothetical protein
MKSVGTRKMLATPIQKRAKAKAAERARRKVDRAKERKRVSGRREKRSWKAEKDCWVLAG